MQNESMEKRVLETLRRIGKPIGEDDYHMIHNAMDSLGSGLGLRYEMKYWEAIDRDFRSSVGSAPYSHDLHEVINSLVGKGKVRRNPNNPIEIEYVGATE